MTDEEKQVKKLEDFRKRRIADYHERALDVQLDGPAFHVLLVPPRSLTEDLNVRLAIDYRDDIAPDNFYRQQYGLGSAETFFNHDGQLALERREGDGVLIHAAQMFHSGAIEIVVPITLQDDGTVDTQFWGHALNLVGKASSSIDRIARDSQFFFLCSLIGTQGFGSLVDGRHYDLTRAHYTFPVVQIADHKDVYCDGVQLVKTRIAHTLGRSNL